MPLLIFQQSGRVPPGLDSGKMLRVNVVVVIFSFLVVSLHHDDTGEARSLAERGLAARSASQQPEPWQDQGFCQMGAVVVNKKSETRCYSLQLLHIHAGTWRRRL